MDAYRRLRADWLFVLADGTRRVETIHWLYSGVELRRLLARAGFDEVRLHGNFEGGDYDADAETLIAVASAPG
jgi:hypothetical protein